MKANHNNRGLGIFVYYIAFTGQRYKIWKQITTKERARTRKVILLLLVKDTKFESKSQLQQLLVICEANCFYWSKIQNLKANHNLPHSLTTLCTIAFTGQRYKIWKQITTNSDASSMRSKLLLLVKDTKFESKSQQDTRALSETKIAFTGQRYKIWKQITTCLNNSYSNLLLLLLVKDTKFESKSQQANACIASMPNCFYWSKIQNLKANHNLLGYLQNLNELLLLVKDTKFESKSQPGLNPYMMMNDCFYWSKIQNLKANHNPFSDFTPD